MVFQKPHRRGAVGRQEARKRRLRGNSRSKAALLPLTACPYRVFLFKALWYSKSPTAEEPWAAGVPEEAPARKLAKQGGAPTVNRMSLPRISVQGTMVFQKPPRRGAVGRQEARKRRLMLSREAWFFIFEGQPGGCLFSFIKVCR